MKNPAAKEPAGQFKKTEYVPLAVLALVFALSVFLLFSHYYSIRDQLSEEFTRERIAEARYAAGQVRNFLEHERGDLVNVAGALSLQGEPEKGKAVMDLFFRTGQRQRKLFSYFILDVKGRFLYSVPESLVDRYLQDLSGEDYFSQAMGKRDFYFSGARPDKKEGWEIIISMPVQLPSKGLGVVVERIDLKALDQLFISKVDSGREGYAILVDDSGRLLANQKGGMLYQVENSSTMLKKMMKGEEGSVVMDSPESGESQLAVFSPVEFSGHVWSVGIITPVSEVNSLARKNLESTLLIFTIISLAFSWSLVAVMRSSRYKASILERTRVSEQLLLRNRELTTLNRLSQTLSGNYDIDSMLAKAIDIIRHDTGASGAAVRLVSPLTGDLILKAHDGMPGTFVDMSSCDEAGECFCGRVMAEGRPAHFGPEGAGVLGEACRACAAGGLVLVPLNVRGKGFGILYLAGMKEEFSEERAKFLLAMGNQLAAGMENLMQIEDTQRHSAMASALFNTAQALTRSLDLDELLKIIMAEAASLLRVQRCLLLLYNEEDNRVDCRVALGFDNSPAGDLSFSPSGVFWESMDDGGVKMVDLAGRKHDVPKEFMERLRLESFVLVPLFSKGKALGFLVMDTLGREKTMLEDLKLIVGFANQAALAIETSSFYIRTVEKYNEDLQQLSTRIIEAQEEERKRISRDLHDELGQFLTAIKINLDMVMDKMPHGSEALKARISDAVGLAVTALDSVRRLSFELRPAMLDDLGLSMVLGKLITDFRKRTGIEVEFIEEGPSERMSPQMEVVLYRVVQEALTNIIKYSNATKVVINLTKEPKRDTVGLYIEDNGAGFALQHDGQAQSKGFGLMGIKERVALLGGNFRIFTEKDRGVKLFVDIPWRKGE